MGKTNTNNGFELYSFSSNKDVVMRYISTENTDYPQYKPQFVINYREFIGEEDYWSYTSIASGNQGISKINNYTGTLSVSDNIFSYTGIRNPLSYKGWELEWTHGRRLDKMENPGYNVNVSFEYDENGIRTQKAVNNFLKECNKKYF